MTTSNIHSIVSLAGAFAEGFVVEAFHLTDGTIEFVEISDEKFGNRRDKTQTMLTGINGDFPTEINAVTCPRCPHFSSARRCQMGLSTSPKKVAPSFPGTSCFFRSPHKGTENGKWPHS